MHNDIEFTEHESYLLARIQDKTITFQRAREILSQIGEKCSSLNRNTVLLDEISVDKREVPPEHIEELAFNAASGKLKKVYMAFLCKPHLIDQDSNLLSIYTSINEFITQHFSDREEAITWLLKNRS